MVRLGGREVVAEGLRLNFWADISHRCMTASWPAFIIGAALVFLVFNAAFALLYWIGDQPIANVPHGAYIDYLYFSIETLSTAGYGDMHPATLYGHIVAATEIVCGLAFTAILTGLTFVRFSRPQAKFVFAPHPVVAVHSGKPTLMLRIGNGRAGALMNAAAKLNVMLSVTNAEGKRFRRAQELRLERAHIPVFPLSWTLMHVIDERSPLYAYDAAQAIGAEAKLFVTLEARDPTIATLVHDVRSYAAEDIHFGMRYADDVFVDEDGTVVVDLTRIGALEPDVGEHWEHGWTEPE